MSTASQQREYYARNPHKKKEKVSRYQRAHAESLSDFYLKKLLKRKGWLESELTPEILTNKRLEIMERRSRIKNTTHENTHSTTDQEGR